MSHLHHSHEPKGNLKVAFLLNLAFTALEFVGGLWTNSVAILSDSLHDAGDSFSLGLAWYLQTLSRRRADATFTYGYRRFSTAGALVTGVVLLVGLGFVAVEAVQRLQDPEPVYVPGMIVLAVVGVLFNGAAAWLLHGGRSLNESMAQWHLLEDTLGWVVVLAGSAAMAAWELPIIDPLLSLLLAAFVMVNVLRNLRRVAHVLLQGAPPGFDLDGFERQVCEIPGIVGSHHTHTWTLDGEHHVFSTHLVLRRSATREEIMAVKQRIYELLKPLHFAHTTIEIELEGEPCSNGAAGCGNRC
jgi:cobalt-zinc-cadmium efflux system protein